MVVLFCNPAHKDSIVFVWREKSQVAVVPPSNGSSKPQRINSHYLKTLAFKYLIVIPTKINCLRRIALDTKRSRLGAFGIIFIPFSFNAAGSLSLDPSPNLGLFGIHVILFAFHDTASLSFNSSSLHFFGIHVIPLSFHNITSPTFDFFSLGSSAFTFVECFLTHQIGTMAGRPWGILGKKIMIYHLISGRGG